MPHFLSPAKNEQFLQELLAGVNEKWHEHEDVCTPYDMRLFLANCMSMCRTGLDCVAYQQCIMDLADVFFKPMEGERERLLRTSTQTKLTRRYFKRNARFVCLAPHAQLRDFYDWYLFWSSYPLPTDPTQFLFVANSLALFKRECKYVQHGQTSDLPGLDYYVLIGTTRGEFSGKKC